MAAMSIDRRVIPHTDVRRWLDHTHGFWIWREVERRVSGLCVDVSVDMLVVGLKGDVAFAPEVLLERQVHRFRLVRHKQRVAAEVARVVRSNSGIVDANGN